MMKSSTYDDFSRDCEILNNQNNHVEVKTVDIDFPECRGMTFREFWEWCPIKLDYKDYENELAIDLSETKHLWVKKCAGLGITEHMLRWIAWNCLKDDIWKDRHIDIDVILITGPRIDLAITIMQRLKALFPSLPKSKETVCILNGVKVVAFPSHHVASAHGLNPIVVLMEEGDLFPKGQQYEAREVAERYIPKTNPWIIWVSTAYLPGGLFEEIEHETEEKCLYRRKFMLLDRALKDGRFTQEQVVEWKKSPSFLREAWGEYGYGLGDVFEGVDDILEVYDLSYTGGRAGTYADPAFGSSKFGKVAGELREGIVYVTEAEEYARASPNTMLDVMVESYNRHKQSCKVDAAHPGFIKDLNTRGVPALAVAFGTLVPEVEGPEKESTMTLKKKMPINASVMVKNRLVRIHPSFKSLISQMRAVKFDKMGGIDKSEVPFDLVDALDMMLWDMQGHDYTSIGITHDGRVIGVPTKHSKTTVTTRIVE